MIHWKKKGFIIQPDREKEWSRTHAMIPTPEDLGDGTFRIYYSGRNDNNQSVITYADISLEPEPRLLSHASAPILEPGRLGCFDDNGVTPSCLVNISSDEKALYYIGWNPGSTVRMHLFGGLAISQDGGRSFQRWSEAPIIERCPTDPFLNTAPFVVKANDEYRMYYVSGTEWKHKDLPRYNIKMATSKDGKHWVRNGHVCIDFKDESENALARPYVLFDEGKWRMWFAHKGAAYTLGYAESDDGIHWSRMDDLAGISPEPGEPDSEMIEYAAVIPYKGRYYMLYNGNTYGYQGILLAVSE